jgi:hypothetical protein
MIRVCSFLCVSLFCAQLTFAQSRPLTPEAQCTPVDLRSEKLGPIRDTKDMNWSYAFAAADLLTQRTPQLDQVRSLKGQRISAEAIAIELQTTHPLQNLTDRLSDNDLFTHMKDDQGDVTDENQTAYRALTHLQTPGEFLCLESEVGSKDYSGADLSEVYDLIDNAATIYRGSKSANFDCNSNYGTAYGQIFPALGFEEIVKSLARSTWNSTKYFVGLKDKACKTRLPFPAGLIVSSEHFNNRNADNYISLIQGELNEGHLSLITFHRGVLLGTDSKKLEHATVAGRRFHNGTCQVLVRTTYGESCSRYKADLACEGGHVWISEADLIPALQRITTLERSN